MEICNPNIFFTNPFNCSNDLTPFSRIALFVINFFTLFIPFFISLCCVNTPSIVEKKPELGAPSEDNFILEKTTELAMTSEDNFIIDIPEEDPFYRFAEHLSDAISRLPKHDAAEIVIVRGSGGRSWPEHLVAKFSMKPDRKILFTIHPRYREDLLPSYEPKALAILKNNNIRVVDFYANGNMTQSDFAEHAWCTRGLLEVSSLFKLKGKAVSK